MDVDYSRGGISQGMDDYSKIQQLKKQRWETQQTQGAAEAYSQSLNPDGTLDEGRYYSLVRELGIAPALATGYRDWTLGQSQAQTELAKQRSGQRGLGFTPDAPQPSQYLQGREQFLNPSAGATSSPLVAGNQQEFAERMAGRANPLRSGAKAPAKTVTEGSAAPTTTPAGGTASGYGVSGASVSGEGGSAAGGTMTPSDPRALEGMGMEPKPQYGQIQGFLATDTGFNPMAALQRGGYTPKTAKDFSNQQAREEFARGLESKAGIPVKRDAKGNADPQSVADGVNALAAQRYQAQFKGFDPFNLGEMFKTTAEGANVAPAAAQGAVEEIGQAGRDIKSTRQAQARTGQEITKTGWEIASVKDAHKEKFGNVTTGNLEAFRDVAHTYDWLKASKADVQEMQADIRGGKQIPADRFGGILIGLTQSMKNGDKITTEKQESEFMANLRRKKSLGNVVHEARGIKDLAELAAKNQIAPQDQAEILSNLDAMLGQQLKSGNTRTALDRYRTSGERAEITLKERGEAAGRRPPKNWTTRPDATAQPNDTWKGHTLAKDGKWY